MEEDCKRADGAPFETDWARALGRDRVLREEELPPATVVGFSALFAVGAAIVWAIFIVIAESAYRASPHAHPAQFPPPLAVMLPYSMASAVMLIPLGARFREVWWPAGFVAALAQLPCGFVILWFLMFPMSPRDVGEGSAFAAVVMPALFYPAATFIGSAGIRHFPRTWMFWTAYAILIAIVLVALGYFSASI
jgi:hypothetical protein